MGNLGFILNCRGDYYSLVPGHANALEPGKPFLITGSAGADDQCMRTIQTFLNIAQQEYRPAGH